MTPLLFSVDVLMERVPLANPWASEQWLPKDVVPVAPRGEPVRDGVLAAQSTPGPLPAPRLVHDGPDGTLWCFPGRTVELHPSEAEGYYLNLTSERPLVFVMWRTGADDEIPAVHPVVVTLSYNQAGRLMDGGERVDPVPLPDALREWMQPFVAEHYKPEPKRKVRRNDPFREGAYRRDEPPPS